MAMTNGEFNSYLWKISVNDPKDGRFYLDRDTVVEQLGLEIFSEDQRGKLNDHLNYMNEHDIERIQVNSLSI